MSGVRQVDVATEPIEPDAQVTPKLSESDRSRRQLSAFRELSAALAEERDLDAIFHLIVDTLSELTGADRCSLHLLDRQTGLFHGQAGHAARDDLVKQLVSGLPGDNFTKEIIETGRPVMLTNTMVDPRPIHAAMLRWRAQSVLGVPMTLRDEVIGILFLDTADTTAEFTQLDQELAISFAEFAATAINQVQLTTQLRGSLRTQAKQLEMLQRARRMEGQLTDIVLRGWGVRELSEAVAKLLSKPCAIYDADFRCLARGGASDALGAKLTALGDHRDHPAIEPILGSLKPGRVQCVPALPQLGIDHRLLITPIDLNGERQGYVVVAEIEGRFGPLDDTIVRRAAHNIALERSRSRLENDMEWHAVEAFTGSLVRGEHQDIEARARSLGVDLDASRVVCLLSARDTSTPLRVTPQQIAQLLTDQDAPSAALASWSGTSIVLILEVPGDLDHVKAVTWVKARLQRVMTVLSPYGQLCAAVSTVAHALGDDQRGHREALQVLRCIRAHLSDAASGILAADDLGVARLLLASTDHEQAHQFACDTLGPLLQDQKVKSEELLTTLESFLRLGRNVRECADELGLHPNTVRYRLTSIEKQTHLAVTTDDSDYMAAQIAMTIVRLSDRLLPVHPATPVT